MRHFVYFSAKARTTGNFDTSKLMDAGRMDIAIHCIINAFFISNKLRDNVKVHLIFYGAPDPPKHIEMKPTDKRFSTEDTEGHWDLSKKDVAGLIKRILFKYKPGKKVEAYSGYFVEKKSLLKVIEELHESGKKIYILDKKGDDIREVKFEESEDQVFLLGDHEGLPQKELKRLKEIFTPITVGPQMYLASQVVTIVNNELDRRGL